MSDDFAAAGRIEQSAISVIDVSWALVGGDTFAVVDPCDLGVPLDDSFMRP